MRRTRPQTVACKKCGASMPSSLRVTGKVFDFGGGFERRAFSGKKSEKLTCPKCGHTTIYTLEDLL